ncbi:MAG: hypothetical protein KF810_02745 [Rhizobiaceae bacterium]|nr:hypothetical protein [Rhizobiaceae bacterium]
MQINPEKQRERAAALANALAPLIETHLASEPKPAPVFASIDKRLLDACGDVAKALDRLDQVRFTAGEIAARRAVLAAAGKVRTVMRNRRQHRDR